MRSIWKGAISFGLVTISVKLYSATEEKNISFHQVHRTDGGRIKYQRVCSVDGEEVQYADIAKGYQLDNGETVVLTDEDLADLPLSTSRAIDVLTFVPLEQVDPIYFAKSYYLEPDKAAAKPYVLLRQALEESGQVAIVKIALRQRESLATLRVRDGVLVLETMIWPDEVRAPEFGFLDEDISVRPQELTMAQSLIESMTGDFDPGEYADDYRAALEQVIEAKVEGREVVEAPDGAQQPVAGVVDLMAALRASVKRAKAGRGETEDAAPAEQPAKKSAGKSAERSTRATTGPAKKPAAKSPAKQASTSAAKKTVPKKTAAAKKKAAPKTAARARRSA